MICPACDSTTSSHTLANVTLNVCTAGCGGIWFDQFEFKKFNEAHEPNPEEAFQMNLPTPPKKRKAEVLTCPRCSDAEIKMMRRFSSPKQKVQVDECAKCAGIWLDLGELGLIRNEYKSDQEREAAAQKMITETFGSQMQAEAKKTKDKIENRPAFLKLLALLLYVER